MKKKSEKKTRIWSDCFYAFKILFSATPIYGLSIIVEAIRHNLINFLEQTICVFYVLNAIEKHKDFLSVVRVILLFLVIDFIAAGISCLYEQKIKIKYLPIAQYSLKQKIYEKAKSVDIRNYDNPSYYNDYRLVVAEADTAVARTEQMIRMIFGSITILLCYGTFFCTQDSISVIFVIVSFVIRTILSNFLNKLRYELKLKQNPLEKKSDYIRRLFYLKDYAKEIRLNKAVTKDFHKQFDEVEDELYKLNKKIACKRFSLDFAAHYLVSDFLLDIVYVLYLILRASIFHVISYSQVVVLYNSAASLRMGFSTIMDLGPFAVEMSLYIEKIRNFLESDSELVDEKKREIPKEPVSLECRNVSFAYDKNGQVLKHVNFVVNPKEKIALVGYNGAGKSTLIKLLLRLYDPDEGEILLDGVNIKEYSLKEYREYIGVVFQDFQVYAASIENNIVMDDVQTDESVVIEATKKSGFYGKLIKLANGLDTRITKEFDDEGIELSGGEEQKLAIARSFFRESGLMLLDEPSSALDPIAEYEMNCALNSIAENKSIVFISHRLSTTRNADRIYVMENGSIMEEGGHEFLLNKGGVYKKMWDAQALKYSGCAH